MTNLSRFEFDLHQFSRIDTPDGYSYFNAGEISTYLGYDRVSNMLRMVSDIHQEQFPFAEETAHTPNMHPVWISELALYKLCFRSNKPSAEAFTEVVADLLSLLRKTGSIGAEPIQKRLDQVTQLYLDAQLELKRYRTDVISENGKMRTTEYYSAVLGQPINQWQAQWLSKALNTRGATESGNWVNRDTAKPDAEVIEAAVERKLITPAEGYQLLKEMRSALA